MTTLHAPSPDGGTIAYRVEGSGPPLVLVPGLGADQTVWDAAVASLAGFTLVRPDNRDVGESAEAPTEDWSTRDSARDVVAVLDHAGIDRTAVYGHSMGGRIAQWVAADHPDRVTRLVLGATTVGDAHGVPRPAGATAALASRDPAAMLDLVVTPAYAAAHPDLADRLAVKVRTPQAAARQMAMSSAHDGWEALPRIVAPTLVVHGTEDGITDVGNAAVLAEHVPTADLLLVRGARHAYVEDFPAANEMVAAFLRADG